MSSYYKKELYFLGRLCAFLGSLGLSVVNFFLIVYTWKMLELGSLNEEDIKGFHQLLICYPLVGEYILISLTVVCLVALIKGGFDKLKSYKDEGLIEGLIWGLIWGLIVGLIWGWTVGLTGGLTFGLTGGLTGGLIWGLIVGLTGSLIVGLIVGLCEEFEK